MLTRIEIDGFKTFEGFGLDLSPFAVVLGVNSAGKSNLFDAVQLLSNLATKDLRTSAQGLRGDVNELFRQESPGRSASQMRLAVEVLVDPVVRDPWGAEVQLKHTRMRYEVVIERRSGERGTERLLVAREQARPILSSLDGWRPFERKATSAFKAKYLKYSRQVPFLDTIDKDGQVSFELRQDGHAGRSRPA
jgi:Protein of unknown function (DUF2813)